MKDNKPPKFDPKFAKENPWSNQNITENKIKRKVDEIIGNIDRKNKLYFKSRRSQKTKENTHLSFFDKHPLLKAGMPLIILISLIYGGILLYGVIWEIRIKQENSRRLLMYQFDDSLTISINQFLENDMNQMFGYQIEDMNFTMNSTVENEIMRIKQDVNKRLKYGISPSIKVEWLKAFDHPNQKPVADCDDFAYLFWKTAQSSNILKGNIFFAATDDLVFAHAFNLIWIDGEWRSIEPQNLDRVLDLSFEGYVNITKEAYENWRSKHRVIIFDVGNTNYAKAVVPLLK